VVHNHPSVLRGGTEAYAVALYEAMKRSPRFEPLLISRLAPEEGHPHHPDAPFTRAGSDPNEYFLYTETDAFDFLFRTYRDKSLYSRFADFLRAHEPDVVHFQHTHFIGYDVITLTRRVLPQTPIVYTLHEFIPICEREGLMVRTIGNQLCTHESPQRCHECFPHVPQQAFYLRKRLVQSHLELVDRFIVPSRFARNRYAQWGLPRHKLVVEPHGWEPRGAPPAPGDDGDERPRNRFAYFGQLNPYKGADVLLEALGLLRDDFDGHLWIFGANFEIQPAAWRERFDELMSARADMVTFAGRYEREQLAALMGGIDWVIVPSIWWENYPLVIQEAFIHGRPVICSDVGGMAENVTDGENGLHFRVGDSNSLAATMRRAASTPGLWQRLRRGIPHVRTMKEHVAALESLYDDLLDARAGAPAEAVPRAR
jgi:glycosyltransferase involved in cell wall biosynthesis